MIMVLKIVMEENEFQISSKREKLNAISRTENQLDLIILNLLNRVPVFEQKSNTKRPEIVISFRGRTPKGRIPDDCQKIFPSLAYGKEAEALEKETAILYEGFEREKTEK